MEPTIPPGVTRPTACVARSKSNQVEPPSALATFLPASTSTRRICERSINEPAVDHAVACRVVPAAAHGDLQPTRPGECEGGCDVVRSPAEHDHGRAAVDGGVVADAGGVVSGVCGVDRLPRQRPVQLVKISVYAHREGR